VVPRHFGSDGDVAPWLHGAVSPALHGGADLDRDLDLDLDLDDT
jgi:hypothetical protein